MLMIRHRDATQPGKGGAMLAGSATPVARNAANGMAGPPEQPQRQGGALPERDGTAPACRQAAGAGPRRLHAPKTHAPAMVPGQRGRDRLCSVGATERCLRLASAHGSGDRPGGLDPAIRRAPQTNAPVIIGPGRARRKGGDPACEIARQPARSGRADLLPMSLPRAMSPSALPCLQARMTGRADLPKAIAADPPAATGEAGRAITGTALPKQRERRAIQQELLTIRREKQSLGSALSARNRQLREALARQQAVALSLRTVLSSTDLATLYLDCALRIRCFTPAMAALFGLIDRDIGRRLEDLPALATEGMLAEDARSVLARLAPVERQFATPRGIRQCRILPCRADGEEVAGLAITFTDRTQPRRAAQETQIADRPAAGAAAAGTAAARADAAKSRILAAASHELRQSLQGLALLKGLLARRVEGADCDRLLARLDATVGTMSGMLDTLLDIDQIDAGLVRTEIGGFGIDDLLARVGGAFAEHARAQGIALRVVPCGLKVRSDPRLLAQMVRNLVSNAIRYTRTGKVLLGCRRRAGMLRIEVWDTGIGIAERALKTIFAGDPEPADPEPDEPPRERYRGLGLGLPVVQRLGALLDHRVQVRSRPGAGSVFSIEVPVCAGEAEAPADRPAPAISLPAPQAAAPGVAGRPARILIVEDDPQLRELLSLILADDAHHADAAGDGAAALHLARSIRPDLVLTDYNLPCAMDGLALVATLRQALGSALPVIILTGDVSAEARNAIAGTSCLQLRKPIRPAELTRAVQGLLAAAPAARNGAAGDADPHVVFVVDDDPNIRDLVRSVLEDDRRIVQDFASCEAFLAAYRAGSDGCLLIDAYLPGMGGLDLLRHLRATGDPLPTIMITGSSDVSMAVEAMKAGAADFIEKPIAAADLLARLARALERSEDSRKLLAWQHSAATQIAGLTPRQHQVMALGLAGHPSKNIAADLGISQRTVENHRAAIMKTSGAKSLPALARLALAATVSAECRGGRQGRSAPIRLSRAAAE